MSSPVSQLVVLATTLLEAGPGGYTLSQRSREQLFCALEASFGRPELTAEVRSLLVFAAFLETKKRSPSAASGIIDVLRGARTAFLSAGIVGLAAPTGNRSEHRARDFVAGPRILGTGMRARKALLFIVLTGMTGACDPSSDPIPDPDAGHHADAGHHPDAGQPDAGGDSTVSVGSALPNGLWAGTLQRTCDSAAAVPVAYEARIDANILLTETNDGTFHARMSDAFRYTSSSTADWLDLQGEAQGRCQAVGREFACTLFATAPVQGHRTLRFSSRFLQWEESFRGEGGACSTSGTLSRR